MYPRTHTQDRRPTLRAVVVSAPGPVVYASASPRRFLVHAVHNPGQQPPVSCARNEGGALGLLEPFVLRLSREVGRHILGGLIRACPWTKGRALRAECAVASPHRRTVTRLHSRKGAEA